MEFQGITARLAAGESRQVMGTEDLKQMADIAISSPDQEAEVLTLREVARILRCSAAHVANLVNGKVVNVPTLAYIRIGRRKVVRRKTLFRWMETVEAQC